MKALILGCGSIGLRHISHLRQLGLSNIEACDPDPTACKKAQEQFGITVNLEPDKALEKGPDIVLVCTPAYLHVPMAMKSLEAGAHVFIEKPLSTSLSGVDVLVRKAKADGRVIQVGYNLRYHPAFKTIKEFLDSGRLGKILSAHAEFGLYLPRWWPHRDYRTSYMANSDTGGGLLLDGSHEIDLLMWFLGAVEELAGYSSKLSNLEIAGIDLVKVVMRMTSGAIASLHIDCLQPTYTRSIVLVGEGTCLRWDCADGRADKSLGCVLWFDPESDQYIRINIQGRPEDTYLEELRGFIHCIVTGKAPSPGLEDGVAVLRVAKAIQQTIETGRYVRVDECLQL